MTRDPRTIGPADSIAIAKEFVSKEAFINCRYSTVVRSWGSSSHRIC